MANAMAGFGALGANRSGSGSFVVGGAAVPASGSVLGADHDFGGYAVLIRNGVAVWWQRFVGTALDAVVGALAASYFEPHTLVFACSVLFSGLICGLLLSDQAFYRFGGITLAIVMLVPRAGPAWQITFHRFAEVSIGIGVPLVLTSYGQKESSRCSGKDEFLGNPARPNGFLGSRGVKSLR